MDSLANSALGMLNGAQPVFDGGVFAPILNQMDLNSTGGPDPKTLAIGHVKQTVLSHGYLWAILCGIFWILLLLLTALTLFILHWRRKSDNSKVIMTYKQVGKKVQGVRRKVRTERCLSIAQVFLFLVMIVLCVTPLIIAFIVNSRLHSVVVSEPNSDQKDAIFPRVNSAINNVIVFLENFAPRTKAAAQPAVEHTIQRTLAMKTKLQDQYEEEFNAALGSSQLLATSREMIDKITVTWYGFYNFTMVAHPEYSDRTDYEILRNEPITLRQMKKSIINLFDKRFQRKCVESHRIECEVVYGQLSKSSIPDVTRPVNDDPVYVLSTSAAGLLASMKQKGKGPKEIEAEYQDGLQKKDAIKKKIDARFAKELNSTELILNTTNAKWEMMEEEMGALVHQLRNISVKINSAAPAKVAGYERSRNLAFLVFLLMMLVVLIYITMTATHSIIRQKPMPNKQRQSFKCCNLVLFIIVGLNVLLTMVLFVGTGYAHTEVCRYLDQQPPEKLLKNSAYMKVNSTMPLDIAFNGFIQRNWPYITKMMEEKNRAENKTGLPPPKPRDFFYGLKTYCRFNQSIMMAINSLESTDLSVMAPNDTTIEFLNKGLDLMVVVMNETDLSSTMRPGMEKDMEDLKEGATIFIESIDYPAAKKKVLQPTIFLDMAMFRSNWTALTEKLASRAASDVILANDIADLTNKIEEFQQSVDQFDRLKLESVQIMTQLEQNQRIIPLVNRVLSLIPQVKMMTGNKTLLIDTAKHYYKKIIYAGTLPGSKKIAEDSATAIIQVTAPCREMYDAYEDVMTATCRSVVHPLGAFFFALGWVVFLATPLLLGLLFLLSKEVGRAKEDESPSMEKKGMELESGAYLTDADAHVAGNNATLPLRSRSKDSEAADGDGDTDIDKNGDVDAKLV